MSITTVLHKCAGGIVVRRYNNRVEFLLLKQIRKTGEIEWVMPKGQIQQGKTSGKAAIREVREESGLEELQVFARLGMQEFQYGEENGIQHEKKVSWYLMGAPYESRLSLNIEEGFVKSKWLRFAEARKQCSHEDFRAWVDRAAETLVSMDIT